MATSTKEDIEILKKHGVEYNVLKRMTNDLCNALQINDLFPSMISNHVIDFRDKAEICTERTERSRVQKLIDDYLIRDLEAWDTGRFYRFLTVMKRSPKCNFLVKRINHWMEQYKEHSAKPCDHVPFVEGQSDKSSSHLTPVTTSTTPANVTTGHVTTTHGYVTKATGHVTTTPGHVTTTPGHVTTTPGHVTTTAGYVTTTAGYVATSPCRSPGAFIIGGDDCLVKGRDSKRCMRLMQKCIIPKISDEWEAVATFLDYTIDEKNKIRDAHNRIATECCKALLEDWLSSDRGVKPKTWKNLLKAIGEVEELQPVLDEIKHGLQSGGITFEVSPVEESYDFNAVEDDEEQTSRGAPNIQYQPQAPYHYQTDPYTEDPTGQGWNQQPQSSIGMGEQFGLYGHYSYDIPSTAVDQHGRPMSTNPMPAPHNRQPYAAGVDQYGSPVATNHTNQQPPALSAFILYSKEEYDPDGGQVLCLSNLLNNYGINCDIDLYHLNENIPDWAFWVGKNVEYHTTSLYSYVILVCSPTMIATLEERNDNACIEMFAGYVDRLTLRHYLLQGAQRVLPLFINKSSADYVPPSLSGKTWYHFPYDTLGELREDISALEVLNHPAFGSLRSLVATLTGQPEHVPPEPQNPPNPVFPGGAVGRPKQQRPTARGSPNIVRRDPYQPPSTLDQDAKVTAPQSVTPRTAELAQNIPHDEQVAVRLSPYGAVGTAGLQRPPMGSNPNIVRRDPYQPPSTNDPDATFRNNTDSLTSQVPHSVTPRSMELGQGQYNMYREQVVVPQQPPMAMQPTDNPSSVATTVQAEEETRGKKRPHDDSSSDNDSCYSTPNESPRDGSLGTPDSTHFPTQATASVPQHSNVHSGISEATSCTEAENNSYQSAMRRQNSNA